MQGLCSLYHRYKFYERGLDRRDISNEMPWRSRTIDETEEKIREGKKCVRHGTRHCLRWKQHRPDYDMEPTLTRVSLFSSVARSRIFISQFEYSPEINPFQPNGFNRYRDALCLSLSKFKRYSATAVTFSLRVSFVGRLEETYRRRR